MIEPRPHLKTLYRDVEHGVKRVNYVRLDRNERVAPLPAEVRREIFDSLRPDALNAYPDPTPLYERLAAVHGVEPGALFVTSGSDTAIRRVIETFTRPGDAIVQPTPSYAMYQVYTQLYEGRAVNVPYSTSRELPLDQLKAHIKARPRMLLIANPDQPTGTAQSSETLRRIVAAARDEDVLVVIDEAYHPFHPETALSWHSEYGNLVVTRTFSKIAGLAGLRVGYLVASPQIVEWIQRTRGSYELNAIAIAAACWILDHPEIERAHQEAVETGRRILRESAARLNLGFPDCATNFQLLKLPAATDLARIVEELKTEGYLVKGPFGAPSLTGCLRVSLAGPEVMQPFTAALERVIGRIGSA